MKIKKIISVFLLSAVVVSSFGTAVSAVYSSVNETIGGQNFAYNHTYYPTSYFQGFYEKSGGGHTQRVATHYDSGSLNGKAYAKITFTNSRGENKSHYKESTIKRGWSDSTWVCADTACTVKEVSFEGFKYNDRGELFIHDYYRIK